MADQPIAVADPTNDAAPRTVAGFLSARAGDRLRELPPLAIMTADAAGAPNFTIGDATGQTMIGFGASFNEAGAICLNALTIEAQEALLAALFDPVEGAGLSAMKTVIAATDFAAAGPFYSYAPEPDDHALASFSIARDLAPDGLVPFIRRAQRHGSFVVQATMDYPPDWMLKDAVTDQDVDPRHYATLAQYFLRYVKAYAEQHIRIDYLSPFNEPGNYTKIGPEGLRDLVRDHLGPLLAQEASGTVLQVCDAQFRFKAPEYLATLLADPAVRRHVGSLSYHGYDYMLQDFPSEVTLEALAAAVRQEPPHPDHGYTGPEFDFVRDLAAAYPDLPLWMTESCYLEMGDAKAPWQPFLPRGDFADGEFWGLQIARDIAAGAAGWTYWNLLLDERGGPALIDPDHGNPAHNVQQPIVIVDRRTGMITYTGVYYYLAHFSRFVVPGSVRLATAGAIDKVTLLAFARPDDCCAVVAINAADSEQSIAIARGDETVRLDLPAHAIASLLWRAR